VGENALFLHTIKKIWGWGCVYPLPFCTLFCRPLSPVLDISEVELHSSFIMRMRVLGGDVHLKCHVVKTCVLFLRILNVECGI